MLRWPLAGHALGLGDLIGDYIASDDIPVFFAFSGPRSAALRYHFTTSAWSCGTPWPLTCMTPRLVFASARPCSASGRQNFRAVA